MLKRVEEDEVDIRIKRISFGLLSPRDISGLSVHEISSKDLYDINTRVPLPNGPLDLRLGVGNKKDKCATCGEGLATCIGHFGEVKLVLPVFNIGLVKNTISTLNCLCKSCGSILLGEKKKIYFKKKLRESSGGNDTKLILRKIIAECKKANVCFVCSSRNGQVKKTFGFRMVHEIEDLEKRKKDKNKGSGGVNSSDYEEINPLMALNIFRMMKEDDYELLGFSESPERLIIQSIIVPPSCIRPSVSMDDEGTNEDDITIKISEIVHTNKVLKEGIEKGNPLNLINEDWDHLQLQCALLINSELPQVGIPGQPIRGIVQRLKGKNGRFRCNLSGKRVDFSGRTVISPDPNLSIEEVGIPERMAKILTISERVTSFNKKKLQALVLNGPEKYPGANYVVGEKFKRFLMYGKKDTELKEGEVVERHLLDGDMVLFNRQPSLHRMSIMSHKVKVHGNKTLRFNECVCTPYNADFDGDEMNVHVPQTEKARAESSILMSVSNNIVTPRHGEPIVAATQDFITGLYLITGKDTFFDRERFGQLVSYFSETRISMKPAIKKPVELFTGKQLVEALIKDSFAASREDYRSPYGGCISLVGKNRSFKTHDDPNDGSVIILDNLYYFGRLDKSIIGGENKKDSLIYAIMKVSNKAAIRVMNSITKLCSRYLGEVGFSIGLDDVQPGPILRQKKETVVGKGYLECENKILEYSKKSESSEEMLEMEISSILNRIREECGSICINELSIRNSPNTMQACGSKGSKINVSQMVACVGQQIVSGTRIPNGMDDRCLPHFRKGSRTPESKGFVRNSFFDGLTSPEFFFHAVSGREGLVDTAVKTAETGYMQRRLMKALEDLSVQYDGSVRNSNMEVVQFSYGEDQIDPVISEGDDPVNLERVFLQAKSVFLHQLNSGRFSHSLQPESCDVIDSLRELIPKGYPIERMINKRFVKSLQELIKSKSEERFSFDGTSFPYFSSRDFVRTFFFMVSQKMMDLIIEPGTTVGAIAGQSIGEPGTQMTLKTFHFAGVASMNITLGVPRLKEIINAVCNISTPIINAELNDSQNLFAAEVIKGRIGRISLKDICSSLTEVVDKEEIFLDIAIDLESLSRLKLNLDIHKIERLLSLHDQIRIVGNNVLRVFIKKITDQSYFNLQKIKKKLLGTRICGAPQISRVIINSNKGQYSLVIEGTGLLSVINTDGIRCSSVTSNSVTEVEEVLGIEAARAQIIHEIEYTISNHGIKIDPRHIMLLADTMTYRGEVFGITRFGISKMSRSTLMLASFEQTSDYLFEAAAQNKSDEICGVSESIILGIPICIGTGSIDLYWRRDS
ncbi:DNA-directed RNA polymerase subunit alpha [Encephalitozoon intestinalis ATCC 50506]|uniref:DNA-directed RNA polymerase subunit n=1 Tax=Encephalitozoon intestinalis (strain ATCC 50506) TaxID=876142 RepID=E0S7T2_ENCIT|nr:DNA-directed RNA polymerase subunit alpha [Encephalitozoon intestinalis ATCC 50506]ADM11767.1 DNA-directed RNA polymerase subunit alpha [Encephalitozoon intestinalis ATCC 50506]UTX45515.1 DNA-directed RNA polymerase III subunit RPC1 [Encephalitozoon intestinalis]